MPPAPAKDSFNMRVWDNVIEQRLRPNTCYNLVDSYGNVGIRLSRQLIDELSDNLTEDEVYQLREQLTNSIFDNITKTLQSKTRKTTNFDIL